jgi:hypothetical protein
LSKFTSFNSSKHIPELWFGEIEERKSIEIVLTL